MCGLTGLVSPVGQAQDDLRQTVEAMTACLRHRGPDAEGVWVEGGIALGHRRLAIIELSEAGSQPMHSACGRYVIVFNGEIYNHEQMRHELQEAGRAVAWRGQSDTETLLAGIAQWGLGQTLVRSKGMFALALWDRTMKRLHLARDRAGEKPLYWGWCGPDFVFGSELKALRQHSDFPKEVCREALTQYLRFGYVPAPRSIHPGIYKLEPGCILEIDCAAPTLPPCTPLRPGEAYGTLSIRRYWSLDELTDASVHAQFADESEALSELEARLKAAVTSQMVADVPLGAFLSGGIDSSLIVALMQAQSARPVRTFTVGFESLAFNEAPHAAAVARHLGTEHTEVLVTEKEARDVILRLPDIYDEPFADSSQISTHLVCRAARAHVAVALSGDAGDELFGGYNRYFWGPRIWRRLDWMPLPAREALGALISGVPVSVWDGLGRFLPRSLSVSHPGDKAMKLAAGLREVRDLDDLYRSLVSQWPASRMVRGVDREPVSILDDPMPAALGDDPASRMMFQDIRSYLPDDILCKVDRAAMSVSLETRVPFLDPDVIKTAARLPLNMKVRGGEGKWALRQILYQHVPRGLIDRPKAGFGIPVGEWLRGPLKPWADNLLSPESLSRDDLIDPTPVRQAWAEHLSGRHDWTHRLWIILMFVAWRDKWYSP
jgi:asparagine synthase (glutamine-hydrolysing)